MSKYQLEGFWLTILTQPKQKQYILTRNSNSTHKLYNFSFKKSSLILNRKLFMSSLIEHIKKLIITRIELFKIRFIYNYMTSMCK